MSPSPGQNPLVRLVGRTAAVLTRLVLIVVIAVITGTLLGALFLPAALATNDVLAAVRTDILDIPPLGDADTPAQNSFIYDADGQELAELTFEENRVPITLREIPQVAIDAVLATEDTDFYEHEGVNHLAIGRAALTNFTAGTIESGASTITQQYVKMAFLTPEQTIQRKIEEAIYAIQIEDQLSKAQILELYLNRAYFGAGTYGIGTAAERYFSKDIGDLTLGEAAMLAGLLRAPEANNPINSLENAQARRDIVLRQMVSSGFVSSDQAFAVIDRPLEPRISEPPPPEFPFWTRWVSRLLTAEGPATRLGTQLDAYNAMGATEEERIRTVFQSGLRIYTTIDPELQGYAEAALSEHLTYEGEPAEEIAREPAGAIVSVEPGTGAIRAMALGPQSFGSCADDDSWVGEPAEDGQVFCDRTTVNPAVPGMGGSGRQPGSSFKPFLTMAALEEGLSPGLTLDARGPQEIPGCEDASGPYEVNNSGGDGILNMYEAIAQSSNVYHALLIAEVTPPKVADMADRVGVQVPARDRENCPLALGATETTPLAMATGYATMANRGEYCAPFPITHIEDAQGNLIWEHSPDCRQVVDEEIADRVIDMLAGPVSAGGTAPIANLGEWPTRGKTGTTQNYRDAWFVGTVKQLATAAWMGYPNGNRFYVDEVTAAAVCGTQRNGTACPPVTQSLTDTTIAGEYYARVFGGTIAAPMWRTYMERAVQRYEPENFVDPGPIPVGEVPNLLAADSQAEAEEIAIDAGFRIRFEGIDDWRPAGEFLEQRPSAGGRLPLGNVIIVEVSNGQGDLPTVPDLRGLTLDEAADRLFAIGYDVGRRDRITDDQAQDGLVIEQSQPPGTPLRPGDGVMVVLDVGVYQEPEPEPEPEPEEPPAEPDPDAPDDGDGNDSSGGGPSDGVGNSRAGGSGDGNGG